MVLALLFVMFVVLSSSVSVLLSVKTVFESKTDGQDIA